MVQSRSVERGCFAALAAGFILPSSCANRPPAPPGPASVFGVEPVIVAVAPEPLVARRVAVDVPRGTLFQPWEPRDETRMDLFRVERTAAGPEESPHGAVVSWRIRRYIVPADGGPERQVDDDLFVMTADGSVAIAESTDFVENVVAVFDPPLVAIPAAMHPGDTVTQQTRLTVHPLRDRSRVQTAGDVNNEIIYVGDEGIRVPLSGPDGSLWRARHLRATFSAKLGPAQVLNVTDQWFADDAGLIAEERNERTTLLGVPFRENLQRWAAVAVNFSPGPQPVGRVAPPPPGSATPVRQDQ